MFFCANIEFSDVEVCVSWQWYNSILSKADAAGGGFFRHGYFSPRRYSFFFWATAFFAKHFSPFCFSPRAFFATGICRSFCFRHGHFSPRAFFAILFRLFVFRLVFVRLVSLLDTSEQSTSSPSPCSSEQSCSSEQELLVRAKLLRLQLQSRY